MHFPHMMFYMANDNPKPRRMRLARLLRGLTQREVAEESGIAENSISRYESGSRVPKPESTEGRRVGGLLKKQKGAPLNLG